ncbi:MAG: hypothetical protein ACM3WV_08405 [Bacillota bacterium]
MLVSTKRCVALRCPLCGRFNLHDFTVFSFQDHKMRVTCACGFHKMIITARRHKDYLLHIPCIICETNHELILDFNRFWHHDTITFTCTDTGIELGYLGEREDVAAIINKAKDNIQSVVNDAGFDDYFSNPEIMYKVLSRLHKLADDKRLQCECGNDNIEVDIFPDKLELRCASCGSVGLIYAETREDLTALERMEKLLLVEGGFSCIDICKYQPQKKKKF